MISPMLTLELGRDGGLLEGELLEDELDELLDEELEDEEDDEELLDELELGEDELELLGLSDDELGDPLCWPGMGFSCASWGCPCWPWDPD